MNASDFCIYCNYVVSEKAIGELVFQCTNCSYSRYALDEETLRYEKHNDTTYVADFITSDDIIEDEISHRIPIKCDCGSLIGVSRIIGQDCKVVKLCINCKKSQE